MSKKAWYTFLYVALIAGTLLSAVYTVSVGSTQLSFQEVYSVILDHVFHADARLNAGEFEITHFKIIWQIRLPRTLFALLVGAGLSAVLFKAMNRGGSLLREYGKLNWAPFVLGLVIVGLEVGYIYAYKAGWPVSTAAIVQSAFLAAALLAVGALVYHEAVTPTKVVGIAICLVGLYFINKG